MYYPRFIKNKIQHVINFFPVVILTGARQTGKTTLLKKMFPDYHYISLDLPSQAKQSEENPDDFLKQNPAPLIIDEIQYAPGFLRHLKYIIDQNRHQMGSYILTGSQKFILMKNISESLSGRACLLDLENLSYQEIVSKKQEFISNDRLLEIIIKGQFPEVWRVENFPIESFYQSYLATYLERDVREILNVKNLRDFERFIRICAARSANLLNMSEIARDIGISVKAVNDWINVLEASGQITLLEPWFENFGKRLIKSPKIYLNDSGLLCYLLGLSEEGLLKSSYLGQVWETFIFSEIRKLNYIAKKPYHLWFYRDQRLREIDFILEKEGRLSFIECKWKENPDQRDIKNIMTVNQDLKTHYKSKQPGVHYIVGKPGVQYSVNSQVQATSLQHLNELFDCY